MSGLEIFGIVILIIIGLVAIISLIAVVYLLHAIAIIMGIPLALMDGFAKGKVPGSKGMFE